MQPDIGKGTTEMKPLPAMKSLGDLSEMLPVIIVDTREHKPLSFSRLPSIVEGLDTGDYSIAGTQEFFWFAVERKTVADLVSCCMNKDDKENRERFERELSRMKAYKFRRVVVVGRRADIRDGKYRSEINPESVLNSVRAWEFRFDVPFWFAGDMDLGSPLDKVKRLAHLDQGATGPELCEQAEYVMSSDAAMELRTAAQIEDWAEIAAQEIVKMPNALKRGTAKAEKGLI